MLSEAAAAVMRSPDPNSADSSRRGSLPVRAGLLLWLVAISLLPARSAPNFAYTPKYVIRSWQVADGLPDNSVTCLAQPSGGYLWLGTFGGLVRFDGAEFETVTDPAAGLTAEAAVIGLRVNHDGRLWVSTMSGMFVLEGGRVLAGVGDRGWPAGAYVRSWTETEDGLYAVSFRGGSCGGAANGGTPFRALARRPEDFRSPPTGRARCGRSGTLKFSDGTEMGG